MLSLLEVAGWTLARVAVAMKNRKDLDELWEATEGTPECPKCGSPLLHSHIREIKEDLAVVDWHCGDCGYKWSNCCPFKDCVLIT